MPEQQYPQPNNIPPANWVPPKPSEFVPNQQAPQLGSSGFQMNAVEPEIDLTKVYPTPPPETVAAPLEQQYLQYQQDGQPYPYGQQPQYPGYQQNTQYPQGQQYPQDGQYPQNQGGPYQQPMGQSMPPQGPQPGYQQPGYPQGQQPLQQPYQQPGYQQQWQQGGGQQIVSNNYAGYLAAGIASLLICGGLLAIPVIVLAIMMNSEYTKGNILQYKTYRTVCRVVLVIALVLGIIANAIVFMALMETQGMMSQYF